MNDMSIITDEHFNQFIDDSKWLQRNYNELIKEFNLELIAIRNRNMIFSIRVENKIEWISIAASSYFAL